jgi:hypothetical protein
VLRKSGSAKMSSLVLKDWTTLKMKTVTNLTMPPLTQWAP